MTDDQIPEDLLDALPAFGRPQLPRTGRESSASLAEIKVQHHKLAQLVAAGLDNTKVAAIAGYSPAYVGQMKNHNPAFRELVSYYLNNHELELLEVRAKQARLGELAVDELTDRLTHQPESFSNRELMEVVDSNTNRPHQIEAASKYPVRDMSPAPVTIQFVTTDVHGTVIEHTPAPPKLENGDDR